MASVSLSGAATVNESVGTHDVTVTLTTSAALAEAVTVQVNLGNDTAVFNGTMGDMYFAGGVNTTAVTFGAGSGNGATQNVSIIINNDQTVEASPGSSPGFNTIERFTVSLGTITGPATATPGDISISIDEDDLAYITMNPTFLPDIPENAGTVNVANVQVRIVSNGTGTQQVQDAFSVPVADFGTGQLNDAFGGSDYTPISTFINFPAGAANNAEIPVPLTIIDDQIDEFYALLTSFNRDREFLDIGFGTSSLRAAYAGVPILIPTSANDNCDGTGGLPNLPGSCRDRATIGIVDDDTAGITVIESGGSTIVNEGGAGDNYTVVLDTQPTSNVNVDISFSSAQLVVNGDTDGTISLIFTPSTWNTAQIVTVFAVNDAIVEQNPLTSVIVQSIFSTDLLYNAIDPADVSVSINDNDTATITLVNSSSSVDENAASPHTVTAQLNLVTNGTPGGVLQSTLTANVNATLDTAEAGDFTQTTTQLIFGAGSVNGASQNIELSMVNDRFLEGDETFTVSLSLVSGTGSVSGSHVVTIVDDEQGAITFALAGSSVAEGADSAVEVLLTITGSGTGALQSETGISVDILQTPGTATTPDDYGSPTTPITFAALTDSPISRTVTTAAVTDDLVEDSETFTLSFGTVTGAGSITASGAHVVTITDGNSAGITVAPPNLTVTEGGTESFTVVLNARPTDDVLIMLTGSEVTTNPTQLTFTNANWNVAQTVNVSAADDTIGQGSRAGSVSFTVSGSLGFNGLTVSPLSVTINDNDINGVIITESGGSTVVTEGGAPDTFTIVLGAEPTADVSVVLTADPQFTLDVDSVLFTPADWASSRTITVTAVDDGIAEAPFNGLITFTTTSSDVNYNNLTPAPVEVTVNDNDTAGLSVSPNLFNLPEDTNRTYTIALLTPPSSSPVTLQVGFDGAQISVNGNTAPFLISLNSTVPETLIFNIPEAFDFNTVRDIAITHTVVSTSAPEYPLGTTAVVTVRIANVPPPPIPLCEDHNFDAGGVVRSSVSDALGYAINCRVLFQNGMPTSWLGNAAYSEANLGVPGLLELGVQQAIDIFSPPGMTYFEGGAVFCLRGQGTFIWLAASGAPRRAEIIGTYTVDDFPGFTCATLFEPGTLVLVSTNPLAE